MAIWFNDTWFSVWEARQSEKGYSLNISNSSKNQDGTYRNDFSGWASVGLKAQKVLENITIPKAGKGTRPMRIKASGTITTGEKPPYATYFNIYKLEIIDSDDSKPTVPEGEEEEF